MPQFLATLEPIDPAQNVTEETFFIVAADGSPIGSMPVDPQVNSVMFSIEPAELAVNATCFVVDSNASIGGGDAPQGTPFPVPAPTPPVPPAFSRNITNIVSVADAFGQRATPPRAASRGSVRKIR